MTFPVEGAYPIEGTHVEASDGDLRVLEGQLIGLLKPLCDLADNAVQVRDQHRKQLDELRERTRSLEGAIRHRDQQIERLTARVRELEANEPPAPWAANKHNDQEAP